MPILPNERSNFEAGRGRRRLGSAIWAWCAALAWAAASLGPALASSALQVSPVIIDVPAPGAVATVSIVNQDAKPTSVQVRVFGWRQAAGEETLTPTRDVVASPPIASIAPGATLSIRVIRAAETPAQSEESYRLVIDQLPAGDAGARTVVAMLIRQVLPVFFAPAEASKPAVTWSLARTSRGLALRAHNSGDRRLRVAKVTLSSGGRAVTLGGGLLGYVLGHSDMSWSLPTRAAPLAAAHAVTIRGESDRGPIDATALVSAHD